MPTMIASRIQVRPGTWSPVSSNLSPVSHRSSVHEPEDHDPVSRPTGRTPESRFGSTPESWLESHGQYAGLVTGRLPGRGRRTGSPSGGSGANSGLGAGSANGGGGAGFSERARSQSTSSSSWKTGIPAWVGRSVLAGAGSAAGGSSARTALVTSGSGSPGRPGETSPTSASASGSRSAAGTTGTTVVGATAEVGGGVVREDETWGFGRVAWTATWVPVISPTCSRRRSR